jgi:SAM-dependent methyltransferase
VDPQRRLSFGSVAELYDRSRPSYPPTLVDQALAFAPAPPAGIAAPRVLEVGAGTGKATVLFAERGASVVAVEPNPEMARIARRNCARFAGVTIVQSEFEPWEPDGAQFELLICAQAWHWIAPDVRMAKAREALVERGALALFWSHPLWETCALADQLRAAYAETVPDFVETPGPMYPDRTDPRASWGDYGVDLDSQHGFDPEPVHEYEWPSEYTTDEYLELIQTHSDHIVLEPVRRDALLAAIAAAIDGAGGALTITYVTYLWLARRTAGLTAG